VLGSLLLLWTLGAFLFVYVWRGGASLCYGVAGRLWGGVGHVRCAEAELKGGGGGGGSSNAQLGTVPAICVG
jgi:hypothetical protein